MQDSVIGATSVFSHASESKHHCDSSQDHIDRNSSEEHLAIELIFAASYDDEDQVEKQKDKRDGEANSSELARAVDIWDFPDELSHEQTQPKMKKA